MMAIASPSSTQSLNGAVWAQLQQQQAQRAADQAEQNARTLQLKARDAQEKASSAEENARTIKVEYHKAEESAGSAKQNLASLEAVSQLQDGLQSLRDQLADLSSSATETSLGVLNAQGQQTGTLVNVTA